jgi:DNA-directed RNA polymerase specialized sigma24 family protein
MSGYDWDRTYKDLCNEIEILSIRRDELSAELRILNRRITSAGPRTKLVASYSGMPGGGNDDRPIEETWNVYSAVTEALEDVTDILSLKLEAKTRMESAMAQFDKLEYQVAYYRDVERLSILQIATKLEYSYDWIAKISSRVKRLRKIS